MNASNILIKLISALVILGGAIVVLQIWGVDVLSWEMFLKVMGTLGVVIVVLGFLIVVRSDFSDHKKLKDDNYLD
ncbi:MAG: hypothetical protein ACPG05_05760 [Bdellovibrionales bacterium]